MKKIEYTVCEGRENSLLPSMLLLHFPEKWRGCSWLAKIDGFESSIFLRTTEWRSFFPSIWLWLCVVKHLFKNRLVFKRKKTCALCEHDLAFSNCEQHPDYLSLPQINGSRVESGSLFMFCFALRVYWCPCFMALATQPNSTASLASCCQETN